MLSLKLRMIRCCHAGFVAFVLSLKPRMMMYQFSQFAWTHTIILVVVVPSSFLG